MSMNTYCTDYGPRRGPFLYRDAQHLTINVREWPGGDSSVGRAMPTSWAPDGAALWKLIIDGSELPGRFVIRNRRFTQAH
jgi:hypothetical protein